MAGAARAAHGARSELQTVSTLHADATSARIAAQALYRRAEEAYEASRRWLVNGLPTSKSEALLDEGYLLGIQADERRDEAKALTARAEEPCQDCWFLASEGPCARHDVANPRCVYCEKAVKECSCEEPPQNAPADLPAIVFVNMAAYRLGIPRQEAAAMAYALAKRHVDRRLVVGISLNMTG